MKATIVLALAIFSIGCDSEKFPPIEGKAAKICVDAGLVPDTHLKPYRCVIDINDPRLK